MHAFVLTVVCFSLMKLVIVGVLPKSKKAEEQTLEQQALARMPFLLFQALIVGWGIALLTGA